MIFWVLFISGSNEINQNGLYGTKGVPSKDNYPGSRYGSVSWFDESNQNLYLFGGEGHYYGYLNDLWLFSFDLKTDHDDEYKKKSNNEMKSSFLYILYHLIEKQIDNNEINEEYFYDDEIQIDEKKFKIHKFILSFRCPELLNYCNDRINELDEKL